MTLAGVELLAAAALPLAAFVAIVAPLAAAVAPQSDAAMDRARRLLREVPVIDGHNDYPWEVRQKAEFDLAKLDMRQRQPSIMTDFERLASAEWAASSGRSTCLRRRPALTRPPQSR
jgi:hypothetical protein